MWLQALTAFGAGSTVTILSDVIYPTHIGDTPLESCAAPSGSNMCAQGSVVVEPPLAPLVPSASVTAPQLVGVCDDLELSGLASTGGGIYPLTFSWEVIDGTDATGGATVNVSVVALREALALQSGSLTSGVVAFGASLLNTGATYRFRLRVVNRAGGVSAAQEVSVTKSASPVLLTTFEGGRSFVRARQTDTISLVGLVTLPQLSCRPNVTAEGLQIGYHWSIAHNDGVLLDLAATDSRIEFSRRTGPYALSLVGSRWHGREIIIPAGSLTAGSTYAVSLTSTTADAGMAAVGHGSIGGSTATLLLTVEQSPLLVTIPGASARRVASATPLTLDAASGSSDPDEPNAILDAYRHAARIRSVVTMEGGS